MHRRKRITQKQLKKVQNTNRSEKQRNEVRERQLTETERGLHNKFDIIGQWCLCAPFDVPTKILCIIFFFRIAEILQSYSLE